MAAKRDKKEEETRKERKREEKAKVGEEEVKEGRCGAERDGG